MAKDSDGSILTKAVQILESFDAKSPTLSGSELARKSGLPVPTAHRIALQMHQLGLLERDDSLRYRVGKRTWELGSRSQRLLTIRDAVMPSLDGVQSVIKHHTQLGILEGRHVLFVELLSSPEAVIKITRVASKLPANSCSPGLILLAYAAPEVQEAFLGGDLEALTSFTTTDPHRLRRELSAVRRQGYATCYGTVHEEAAGVAVPIFDRRNQVVAAISVIVPNTKRAAASALPVLLAASRAGSTAVRRTLALSDPEDH